MLELLKELTALTGPCGFEHDVAKYIYLRAKAWADEVQVDGVGNVIVKKHGKHPGPVLMVSVHMDEVGFIVKKVESNGLIRFEKLGGHDDRILLAERIKIRTQNGFVEGVIGTISAHMQKFDDASRVRNHRELYIDVGADTAEEVHRMGVRVGQPISWANPLEMLGPHRIVSKALDDRTGCAVLLHVMEQLDYDQVHGTVYGVFSVQEEVGLRGARVAAHQIAADVALAIDTTAVSDTPEAMMDKTLSLGQGPGIKVMDFSLIASSAVRDELVRVAEEQGLPYQLEVFPGIGTDAGELTMAHRGIPTGVISVPSRYAHSPVEVVDIRDLYNTAELLKGFILNMKDKDQFSFLNMD